MKTCRTCGRPFQATAHQLTKSDFICSPCNSKFQKDYRKRRITSGRPLKGGKASAEWWKKYRSAYYSYPANKKRIAANQRRYRNDPALRMKHEARWQANRALKAGKIKRLPCSKCGKPKTQMHHPDYYKPLEVIFLCTECHRKEHSKAKGQV